MGGQLALNQLLVTMDGIDNPPFMRRVFTNKTNTFLDAIYIVPRRLGRYTLRLPAPRPLGAQIYFIGATNVPLDALDPALTRPGRMGRHVYFRTPTKEDRADIFDLYLDKVAHDPELDTPARRDEIARITNGYSPAMIDQICSMALTNAHHEGSAAFGWEHLVDAMTVIEAGSAVSVKYTEHETRAVAIHEAGHAATAHVYRPQIESSRLSIRMRGGSLGHHQFFEKDERFSAFQSELIGSLIHTLGAMAAELVFFGENSIGVGGDLQSATSRAAFMVGASGMSPLPLDLHGKTFADESEAETQERVMKRFEDIGLRLLNRTSGGPMTGDPISAVLGDPRKRAYAAQFLGEAFVTAYNLIMHNRDAVERIANIVIEKKEIFGDELVRFLDEQSFEKPEIDWTDEASWPNMTWSRDETRDPKDRGEPTGVPGMTDVPAGSTPEAVDRGVVPLRPLQSDESQEVHDALRRRLHGARNRLRRRRHRIRRPHHPSRRGQRARRGRRWKPKTGNVTSMTKQISDHIAASYRLSEAGGQLLAVLSSKPAITSGTPASPAEGDRDPQGAAEQRRHPHHRRHLEDAPVHPLRAREELLDRERYSIGYEGTARPARGARDGALHLQVRSVGRLGHRVHAAGARRDDGLGALSREERSQGSAEAAAEQDAAARDAAAAQRGEPCRGRDDRQADAQERVLVRADRDPDRRRGNHPRSRLLALGSERG